MLTAALDQKLKEYQAERDQVYLRVCASDEYQRLVSLDGSIAALTALKNEANEQPEQGDEQLLNES